MEGSSEPGSGGEEEPTLIPFLEEEGNGTAELWHLYKSLLPSAKGLSIYFMQFLFLFESPSSLIKHQLGSTMIILVHWM